MCPPGSLDSPGEVLAMNDADWMKKWHRRGKGGKPGCVVLLMGLGLLGWAAWAAAV